MPVFNKKVNYPMNYLSAILIGSLTGLIGFGIFLSLVLIGDNKEQEQAVTPVVTQPEPVTGDAVTFYAVQHGVFSSEESAAEFKNTFPQLNLSSIVQHENQFYVWSKITNEKADAASITPTAFYKAIKLSSSCEKHSKLLSELKGLDENILSRKNELSTNFPDAWVQTFNQITQLSNDPNVWRLQLVATDLEVKTCLNLNF
jgi:hypothetical protein